MKNILYTSFHREDGGGHTTYVDTLVKEGPFNKYVACPETSLLYKKLHQRGHTKLINMQFPSKPKYIKQIIESAYKLKNAIEEFDIDLVHTNGSQDNRMALYASLLTRKKFKVVFTKHNSYPIKGHVSRLRFNYFNDAVIFVSRSVYDTIGFSSFRPPVHVIENGIDLAHWKRGTPLETGTDLFFISNTALSLHKGWTYLVEAVNGLPADMQKRISIAVLGTLELEEKRNWAKTQCNINFPGFLTDARPLLEEADVGFVLSYGSETISFACREMMAMGIPVMVSEYGSLPDNVDPGCGWVTKTKDVLSIRETVRNILEMPPDQLTEMKRKAREKATACFSSEHMIAQTDAVYASLLDVVL